MGIDLPVVNHATCQTELRKTRLGKRFRLHNSLLCAGGEPGKDTCKGDGGSPLVCPRGDGSYVQAGIVAWGVGCGETGTPGVYADVSKAVVWPNNNNNVDQFARQEEEDSYSVNDETNGQDP